MAGWRRGGFPGPEGGASIPLLVVGVLLLSPLAGGEPAAKRSLRLRPRVWADEVSGTAFRFPFDWLVPDHCGDAVLDPRVWRQGRRRPGRANAGDGTTAAAEATTGAALPSPPTWIATGVRHFSRIDAQIPEAVRQGGPEAVAAHLGGGEPAAAAAFAYTAAAPDRPHVQPWDDMPAVEALTADFTGCGRMLLVRHADRWSGLLVGAAVPAADAEAIIRSFELMRPFARRRVTWREWHGLCRRAIDVDGTPTPVGRAGRRKDFDRGWEVESRFYHLTGTANASEMQRVCARLDAQHRALQVWLPLDEPQRVKFEILLTMTQQEFAELAPRFTWGGGGNVAALQGFFSGAARAILSFTQHVANTPATTDIRLGHEAVHQYLHLHAGQWPLPQWLDEGLAVTFEEGQPGAGCFALGAPHLRLTHLKLLYRQQREPIATPQQYLAGHQGLNVHMYAEMYTMVRSLVLGQEDGVALLGAWWRGVRAREGRPAELVWTTLLKDRLAAAGDDRGEALRRWGAEMFDDVLHDRLRASAGIIPVPERP